MSVCAQLAAGVSSPTWIYYHPVSRTVGLKDILSFQSYHVGPQQDLCLLRGSSRYVNDLMPRWDFLLAYFWSVSENFREDSN